MDGEHPDAVGVKRHFLAAGTLSSMVAKLQIVGGGKMGQALLAGLVAAEWAEPGELYVADPVPETRAAVEAAHPGVAVGETALAGTDTLLAVKPHLAVTVARQLESPTRLLSVAAGVTIAALEEAVGGGVPVIRSMPNTPALLRAGAAALAPGSVAVAEDVEWGLGILGAVGAAVEVTEAQLDAVTGLSGSGPAYLFLVAEAMTDAGVQVGLPRDLAATLAHATIHGAGKMLTETGQSATDLRAAVTTPAGTTAAGLAALEQGAVRADIAAAVRAATERSRALGS